MRSLFLFILLGATSGSDEVRILFQSFSICDIARIAALFEDACQVPPQTDFFCKRVKIKTSFEYFKIPQACPYKEEERAHLELSGV